jgi:ketosteroid isomerase-like protein
MIKTNPTPKPDDLRSYVFQREAEWERALSMNDAAGLDEVMADDWRMISAEGQVITKAQALSALRSGVLRYDSVTFEEVEVRAYPGAAIVMGRSRERGNLRGASFDENYIFTDVFLPHGGAWRSVLTHTTHVSR